MIMNIKNSLKHVNINEYEYEFFFEDYKKFGKFGNNWKIFYLMGFFGVVKNFEKKIKL